MNVEPIGVVHSPVKEQTDSGWGSAVCDIVIADKYAEGLKGLAEFSHILVVFYMDKSTFDIKADLIRRPQGRADMPETGIFAQRAKHRPNPIGLTAVKLEAISGNVLTVLGLDAIDGTPVLDIKPYFEQYDKVGHPVMHEWVSRLMENYF